MEIKNKGIRLITLIVILIFFVVIEGIYIIKLKSDIQIKNNDLTDTSIQNDLVEQAQKQIPTDFNEAMVEYILDSIQAYAENGYILKSNTGDVEAERLSRAEAIEKREEYKQKISSLLEDENYFGKSFKKDDIEKCTFKFEKILNNIELGTNQGIGIGIYDDNGNKLYEYGKDSIETSIPIITDIVQYFGYDINIMIDNILDSIESYAERGYIFKSTNDLSEKLTVDEAKENREMYRNKIIDILDNKDIFNKTIFENEKLTCSYNFEKVLNALEISSNHYEGIETDENGYKTYEF